MPRSPKNARRKVWRPVRQLPADGSDAFNRLILGPHSDKLMSRALGKRLQEGRKTLDALSNEGGRWFFTEPFDRELQERKSRLENELIPNAGKKEAERPLSHVEKDGLRAVLHEQLKILNREPMMHAFFRKWYDIGSAFQKIDSFQSIIVIASKTPQKHLKTYKSNDPISDAEDAVWRNAGPKFVKLMCHLALTQMMHRHLSVMNIPASYHEVSHTVENITQNIHPADYLESPRMALGLERMIEDVVVKHRRDQRVKKHVSEIDTAHQMKRMKHLLQGFDMPRPERKKIYREARERIRNRQENRETHVARTIANRAFKRSREHAERVLRNLGIDVESLFTSMGIITTRDRITTTAMRNLKLLNEIIRTHPSPDERKRRIIALMEEGKDLSKTAIQRIVPILPSEPKAARPERNPRKEMERAARRERQVEDRKTVKEKPADGPKPLPKGINGYIAYFRDEQTISREALVSLRKMLRHINPREVAKETIVKAIEYSILCEMATHHKKKGRVQERSLRSETTPQTLFEYYKMAQSNLMSQGILKYEFHYGRSDFIALTEEAASRILGKYDTKNGR